MADSTSRELGRPEYWDALVHRGFDAASDAARAVLRDPASTSDERALAFAAVGATLFDRGALKDARVAAEAALDAAASSTRPEIRWSVATGAAVVLAESGLVDQALGQLRLVEADLDEVHRGRLHIQSAYILHQAGRLVEALESLDVAEHLLRVDGEPRDRLRLLINRGLVLLQQGRFDAADRDYVDAEATAAELGMTAALAQCAANRGTLHGRARRLTESVRHFDRARVLFERAGNPARTVAIMHIDRAEVLMLSGLVVDAVAAARLALALAEPTGNPVVVGDAQLMLARTELAASRTRDAVRSAQLAHTVLEGSGRVDMLAHARFVASVAELQAAGRAGGLAAADATAAALAADLRAAGWEALADELLIARVRAAYEADRIDAVADELEVLRLGAFAAERRLALAGWLAEALVRLRQGRAEDAIDACRSGLDHVDDIVAEAPTLEQRSAAVRLGADLSQLIIDVAVDLGDADTTLSAAEGTRARSLHEELVDERPHRPLTDAGAEQLRRELTGRLGDRVLVEWVVRRDGVHAVIVSGGKTRLVDVASCAEVRRARDRVLAWIDRAVAEPDVGSERAERAMALLDELLVGPLGLADAGEVVIVPVGLLHGIPWSGLPSLARCAVTVVPTAQLWLAADRRASAPLRSAGLVIGPDLPGTDQERRSFERAHPGCVVAAGEGSTPAAVASMFNGLDLVHVAAHGSFRLDRPLLSSIRLHGGEATLDRILPRRIHSPLVILSSCEGGQQGVSDGSEVLGFASVMLARGAAGVLGPLTVVRDLECGDFVAEIHERLAGGARFVDAVADVRARWLDDHDLSRWAVASSFTCFGSGALRVTPARAG